MPLAVGAAASGGWSMLGHRVWFTDGPCEALAHGCTTLKAACCRLAWTWQGFSHLAFEEALKSYQHGRTYLERNAHTVGVMAARFQSALLPGHGLQYPIALIV